MLGKMSVIPLSQTRLEHEIFPRINKPARYLGMEFGAYRKDPKLAKVLTTMIFPDLYEIGVSNYGHKLLYSLINNQPDYLCDRAYAPAKDMRELMASENIPLYGLETLIPLKDFDLLAFTLQYELNYTTILGVLEAAQIPFRTVDRDDSMPILIAGGPGSGNPMPLSPFFDAFTLGDGEEVLIEILDLLKEAKQQGWTNAETRQALAGIEGMYVPGISTKVRKRIFDITKQSIELAPLIPYIQTVHDRVTIEARRGCDRMCRFCQPCFVNLPVREQKIETIRNQALQEIAKTGYEECSLLSLSIADYSQLKPLIHEVADALNDKGVSLSLPSQRADRFDLEVAEAVQQVRKSTLTFAPEAGTERLRKVVNKNLTEKEILDAVISSYQAGWNKVKLYFMIGLPTETEADLLGIVNLVKKIQAMCAEISRAQSKSFKSKLDINITFSNFVPKPHTPFQWVAQDSLAVLYGKREFLKQAFKGVKGLKLNFTDPEISKLEAVISKGDERMAEVIQKAYEKGGYLDAWEENLKFSEWFDALQEAGIDPDHFTSKTYTRLDEALPWDGIDMGLEKSWLREEYLKSIEEAQSDPCFVGCNTCGVCHNFQVQPVFIKPAEAQNLAPRIIAPKTRKELFRLPQWKARLTVQKQGSLRFISHLDWLRMLQRAIFRAGLPIAYSQGFNPTPRMSFGPALPMFTEGLEEYLDLEMADKVPDLVERLNRHLPEDGKILSYKWLPLNAPNIDKLLQYCIYSARWTCENPDSRYTISEKVNMLLAQDYWQVVPEKVSPPKGIDIKPYISDIIVSSFEDIQFTIQGVTRENGQTNGRSVKPAWFLNLIDPQAAWSIKRLKVGIHDPLQSFKTLVH